ncbi:unnamed protein product [Gongylonema pulchrum]|uniref:tRNA-synt_2 domain-containing protein n=1 Tax=Gongylonema pulchrum TaxID=637853 RepID=A0A183F0M1_9BILA|nr:unnamed protein product [Gongylonema pulchrum]
MAQSIREFFAKFVDFQPLNKERSEKVFAGICRGHSPHPVAAKVEKQSGKRKNSKKDEVGDGQSLYL